MRIGDLAWWLLVVKFATPLVVAHALGRTTFVHVAAVVAWMLAASIASELVIATFRRRMHARWAAEAEAHRLRDGLGADELGVVLDERDFARVLEMVDAPPEPTPQLVEVMKQADDDPGAP
jgi:hypothetical protein